MGFGVSELFASTIKGDSGNQEYLVVVRKVRLL
jgi:predicted rRNA methylase YqxC with S4 and FtsJ domains